MKALTPSPPSPNADDDAEEAAACSRRHSTLVAWAYKNARRADWFTADTPTRQCRLEADEAGKRAARARPFPVIVVSKPAELTVISRAP